MPQKVLIKRTSTANSPPAALDPGELAVEMANPLRLWVGVPTTLDATGKKLLVPLFGGLTYAGIYGPTKNMVLSAGGYPLNAALGPTTTPTQISIRADEFTLYDVTTGRTIRSTLTTPIVITPAGLTPGTWIDVWLFSDTNGGALEVAVAPHPTPPPAPAGKPMRAYCGIVRYQGSSVFTATLSRDRETRIMTTGFNWVSTTLNTWVDVDVSGWLAPNAAAWHFGINFAPSTASQIRGNVALGNRDIDIESLGGYGTPAVGVEGSFWMFRQLTNVISVTSDVLAYTYLNLFGWRI